MAKSKQPAAESAGRGVIVTVDPQVGLDAVIELIRKAGVKIGERMDALHVLTVQGAPGAIAALRKVPGVLSVDKDTMVRLDPREIPDLGRRFAADAPDLGPSLTGSSWKSSNWDD
jgi:hypothetical protein